MTLTKQRKMLIAAIAVLVLLNGLRWWPSSTSETKSPGGSFAPRVSQGAFRAEDFEIRALPAEQTGAMQRDLFQPKAAIKPASAPLPKVQGPPPKTPEELAREAAQAELAQIRCVGVAFRGGKAHAYLQKGGESQLVSPGDKAGSRFVVEKITPEAVSLKDPDTGVEGTLTVSGK